MDHAHLLRQILTLTTAAELADDWRVHKSQPGRWARGETPIPGPVTLLIEGRAYRDGFISSGKREKTLSK